MSFIQSFKTVVTEVAMIVGLVLAYFITAKIGGILW
jgi:hypothetical protein